MVLKSCGKRTTTSFRPLYVSSQGASGQRKWLWYMKYLIVTAYDASRHNSIFFYPALCVVFF